jgi:hypothetical protein
VLESTHQSAINMPVSDFQCLGNATPVSAPDRKPRTNADEVTHAFSTSPGADCQVPNPIWGMVSPLFLLSATSPRSAYKVTVLPSDIILLSVDCKSKKVLMESWLYIQSGVICQVSSLK